MGQILTCQPWLRGCAELQPRGFQAGTDQVPSPGSPSCSRDLVLPPAKSLWLDSGSKCCQVISSPRLSIEDDFYLLSHPRAGSGEEHPSLVLAAPAGEKMGFAKPPDLILWGRSASCGQVSMEIQVRVSRYICGPDGGGRCCPGLCPHTGASFGNGICHTKALTLSLLPESWENLPLQLRSWKNPGNPQMGMLGSNTEINPRLLHPGGILALCPNTSQCCALFLAQSSRRSILSSGGALGATNPSPAARPSLTCIYRADPSDFPCPFPYFSWKREGTNTLLEFSHKTLFYPRSQNPLGNIH